MEDISMDMDAFHIPPNEIPDILPQHLLMLKLCRNALLDAGVTLQRETAADGCDGGCGF